MATAAEPQPKSGLPGNLLVIVLVLVLAWQAAYWTGSSCAAAVAAPAATQASIDLALPRALFRRDRSGRGRSGSSSLSKRA